MEMERVAWVLGRWGVDLEREGGDVVGGLKGEGKGVKRKAGGDEEDGGDEEQVEKKKAKKSLKQKPAEAKAKAKVPAEGVRRSSRRKMT